MPGSVWMISHDCEEHCLLSVWSTEAKAKGEVGRLVGTNKYRYFELDLDEINVDEPNERG